MLSSKAGAGPAAQAPSGTVTTYPTNLERDIKQNTVELLQKENTHLQTMPLTVAFPAGNKSEQTTFYRRLKVDIKLKLSDIKIKLKFLDDEKNAVVKIVSALEYWQEHLGVPAFKEQEGLLKRANPLLSSVTVITPLIAKSADSKQPDAFYLHRPLNVETGKWEATLVLKPVAGEENMYELYDAKLGLKQLYFDYTLAPLMGDVLVLTAPIQTKVLRPYLSNDENLYLDFDKNRLRLGSFNFYHYCPTHNNLNIECVLTYDEISAVFLCPFGFVDKPNLDASAIFSQADQVAVAASIAQFKCYMSDIQLIEIKQGAYALQRAAKQANDLISIKLLSDLFLLFLNKRDVELIAQTHAAIQLFITQEPQLKQKKMDDAKAVVVPAAGSAGFFATNTPKAKVLQFEDFFEGDAKQLAALKAGMFIYNYISDNKIISGEWRLDANFGIAGMYNRNCIAAESRGQRNELQMRQLSLQKSHEIVFVGVFDSDERVPIDISFVRFKLPADTSEKIAGVETILKGIQKFVNKAGPDVELANIGNKDRELHAMSGSKK